MSTWWKETSIYQVYPRSFCDSNGDGIGDIKGIISKVDYLVDLGVETVWFSPFYESPQEDHGYDISDYTAVHHEYGTMEDVEEMIHVFHEKGLKVVFDMVMNHTSRKHKWFLDSIERKNGKDDWYIWRDGKKTCAGALGPPNNWRSMVGPNGWVYHEERKQYYFCSFLDFQPDLNYRNPEVKAAMLNVVKFWMDKGVDGFRLDIFNAIYKDASFADNPFSWRPIPSHEEEDGFFQSKIYTINHADTLQFARELRGFMDTQSAIKKERFLVGEVIGRPQVLKSYMGDSHDPGLNLVFMFETLDFEFSAKYFEDLIHKFEKHYPAPYYKPVLVFSNHDIRRIMYRVDGSLAQAKVVALLQLTLRGVPCIYYGDEIGMTEGEIALANGEDPVAKLYSRLVPQFIYDSWLLKGVSMNRDNCRTPMQWNRDPSRNWKKPWLPLNKDIAKVNVAVQAVDSESILSLYKRLLSLRKMEPALRSEEIIVLSAVPANDSLLCYKRIDEESNSCLIICINFGSTIAQIEAGMLSMARLKVVCATDSRNVLEEGKINIFGSTGLVLKEL